MYDHIQGVISGNGIRNAGYASANIKPDSEYLRGQREHFL